MTISIQDKITAYQQLIAGIQKNAPNLVLMIANQTYTTPQIVTVLQSLINTGTTVSGAKTAWHDAVQGNQKAEAQYGPLVTELRQMIELMYSSAETTLAEFGLQPKKPRKPLTTEALAARAAKAKATRAARGTTSKKQKSTISGNVTGVTITPVTTLSSTPAASTSSAGTAATSVAPATPPAVSAPVPSGTSNGATPTASTTAHA